MLRSISEANTKISVITLKLIIERDINDIPTISIFHSWEHC